MNQGNSYDSSRGGYYKQKLGEHIQARQVHDRAPPLDLDLEMGRKELETPPLEAPVAADEDSMASQKRGGPPKGPTKGPTTRPLWWLWGRT